MTEEFGSHDLIPDQLLDNFRKGNAVLFLGTDLPLEYEGAPLSQPQLVEKLTKKFNLPPNQSWPETAQAFLGIFGGDRHRLISFVSEYCSGPRIKPGPLHQAIATVGFRVIVTTCYDDLLKQVITQAGYRVSQIVRDTEVPYAREGSEDVILIKLFGSIEDPESLVLDTWDQTSLMDRFSRKLELVTAFCSLRPPLFIGFDMTREIPRHLYVRTSKNMTKHMRKAFCVWPKSINTIQRLWYDQNIEFINADATSFLNALSKGTLTDRTSRKKAIRVDRPPYKFLDYYESDDADIFCGRDNESQIVARLLLTHRLITLFGPSGTGKTSLLLAGVLPLLAAEGYRHVYIRVLDNPLSTIRKAVAERFDSTNRQVEQTLRDFFQYQLKTSDKLIIILDQFEELFIRIGSTQRQNLFRELSDVIENPEREVRFIISLREDYLARLDEARLYLPNIFTHSFRLSTLDRFSARVAITEPAARAGVTIETQLVDALVGSEGRDSENYQVGDLVEAGGQVPPAALQIVLDRLYREALSSCHLAESAINIEIKLTMDLYRSIRYRKLETKQPQELEGARAILVGYLDEALRRVSNLEEISDADPVLAEAILKVMVTSQGTKAVRMNEEILNLLHDEGIIQADDPTDQALVEKARLSLEKLRLVRSLEQDGRAFYELIHDHLAIEIATRVSEHEIQTKQVRELLQRELDNWRSAGLLISSNALQLINERRDDLKRLSEEEVELIVQSSLVTGMSVSYWTEKVQNINFFIKVASKALNSIDFRLRAHTVTELAKSNIEKNIRIIAKMLKDPYPQVRVRAIRALEGYGIQVWRRYWQPYALRKLRRENYIPPGPFVMGVESTEPVYNVNLEAFYTGRYPVTNAEYKRYMDDMKRSFDIPEGKSDHPVVNISWFEAYEYASWAEMRLLTEAEWEKAAGWVESKGIKFRYPWGDKFDPRKCNTRSDGDTTPVGKYSPHGDSRYGVVDMTGNVWEWTSSLYFEYPYHPDDGREDLTVPYRRVMRGGAFDHEFNAQITYRYPNDPKSVSKYFGFRVGLSAKFPNSQDLGSPCNAQNIP